MNHWQNEIKNTPTSHSAYQPRRITYISLSPWGFCILCSFYLEAPTSPFAFISHNHVFYSIGSYLSNYRQGGTSSTRIPWLPGWVGGSSLSSYNILDYHHQAHMYITQGPKLPVTMSLSCTLILAIVIGSRNGPKTQAGDQSGPFLGTAIWTQLQLCYLLQPMKYRWKWHVSLSSFNLHDHPVKKALLPHFTDRDAAREDFCNPPKVQC